MARAIKETPILHGEEAMRLTEVMKTNLKRKVSPEERARGRKIFDRLKKSSNCLA